MQKIVYRVTQIFFALSCVGIVLYNLYAGAPIRAILGPVGLLFLLIPSAGEKLLRIQLGYGLKIVILIFCFLGYNLGTGLQGYAHFPLLDKFNHLVSGLLFTLIGLCLYARTRKIAISLGEEWFLQASYALFLSMAIAVAWEVYEFLLFVLAGHDAQHHLTTGVFDTMEDLIACLIGSVAMAGLFAAYAKKGAKLGIMSAYEAFLKLNPKPLRGAE